MQRRRFLTGFGTAVVTGAVIRPAMAQSARSFGVVPGANSDQSHRFQRMINRAALQRRKIRLAPGKYLISNINLPSHTHIEGPGAVLIANGDNPILLGQNASSVHLSGLAIQSGVQGPASDEIGLVDIRNVANLHLIDLKIDGAPNDAIYLENVSGKIFNCQVENAGRFAIFTRQSTGLSILNNSISSCGDGGIIVHRWENGADGTVIANNRIDRIGASRGGSGQWGNGINVFRADDVIVENNDISDCAYTAVRANTTKNTQIVSNRCFRCGETAIYAEFGFRNARITDNLIDGAANGISATNLDHGGAGSIIKNNTIRNITAPGPYEPEAPYFGHGISVEADSLVADNTIEHTKGYGINVGWGPYLRDVTVIGNTITDAEIGIGVTAVNGAGNATIRNNKINARNGAIRSHQWSEINATDLALKPDVAPSHVEIIDNAIS